MWDINQYNKFEKERRHPFNDLLTLICQEKEMSVLDLGCGSGALTSILCDQVGAKKGVGIDSSAQMLRGSRNRHNLNFYEISIEEFIPQESFDLIFSNSALQWIPEHRALFTRLFSYLTPRGQIAIQMPSHCENLTHRVAEELASRNHFKKYFNKEEKPFHVLALEDYAFLFFSLGFSKQVVRCQLYPILMPSRDKVVEFVKGSLLTYYEKKLPPHLYLDFLDQYIALLFTKMPDYRPYFYLTKRFLLWAQK